MKTRLGKALRWLAVFLVTLVVCSVGSFFVFVTQLFVVESVSRPLTLIVMGVLATLGASWGSNLLGGEATHARILRILIPVELFALVLFVFQGVFVSFADLAASPNLALFLVWSLLVSVVAYVCAWKYRTADYSTRRDVILTAILLLSAPAIVIGTIEVASMFGLVGA